MEISFFSHEVPFTLEKQELVTNWLLLLVEREGKQLDSLSYVFVSDEYLLELNKAHLQHDYYTDILTFPYHEEGNPIVGEIYISVDRVRDNATTYEQHFLKEMHRVMAHGLLHLMGYDDHEEEDIKRMRDKESHALSVWDELYG